MTNPTGFTWNLFMTQKTDFSDISATDLSGCLLPTGPDYSRDALLTEFGKATLRDRYMLETETSPQEAFWRAARAWADDENHARRLYSYVSRLWFMFSSPVLSNAPVRTSWGKSFEDNFKAHHFGDQVRGMPISCFLNYVDDSRTGITDHYTENAMLSSMGGGIGAYWGAIRTAGAETSGGSASSGAVPFMGVMDRLVLAFAQGKTRRASYVMYTDIGHPEILEFISLRKPTGGDLNRKTLNLHNAVCVSDAFMEILERCMKDENANDDWPLIDPHTKQVVQVVSARALWQQLLEIRVQTGEPYLFFVDTANRAMPRSQREMGLRIHASNLCAEITLPTNKDRTAVCCLSSVNLEHFDEWSKDPRFIEDIVRMLDNVLEFFIQNAGEVKQSAREALKDDVLTHYAERLGVVIDETELERVVSYLVERQLNVVRRAVYSARCERSIGLGAMGFHSLLQSKGIAFEGVAAMSMNRRVFAHLDSHALEASIKLAHERGAAPDAGGEMLRNMCRIAVAPNATSGIICGGVSPSIEPHRANAFTQKTDSGSWLVKNRHLERVLDACGQNTDEVWSSIVASEGSVQHLDFLSKEEKDVFKTAMELDQRWLIEHAARRQPYICQSQSLNLFLAPNVQIPYLHAVHYQAWKSGLKSLYYVRSSTMKRANNSTDAMQQAQTAPAARLEELLSTEAVCMACEG